MTSNIVSFDKFKNKQTTDEDGEFMFLFCNECVSDPPSFAPILFVDEKETAHIVGLSCECGNETKIENGVLSDDQ